MNDVSDSVLHEARRAGMRVGRPVSAREVRRRRRQLYLLVAVVVLTVTASVAQLTAMPTDAGPLQLSPTRGVAALTALIVAFCLYCLEKEVHLRRVERLLAEERDYSAEVTGRLGEVTSLLEAGRAMNSAMELREVLDAVLTHALALFAGATGSVSLLERGDELECVSAIGNDAAVGTRTRLGQGITGRVAQTREPVIIDGRASQERFPGVVPRGRPEDSAMCVPLIHRDRLVGVLSVSAYGENRFGHGDLQMLCLFASYATSAIAHARLHEDDRARVEALVKLEQSKTDFISGVSHDLRTPLTSIVGCTSMARRTDVPAAQRDELLEIAESQAKRLAGMVERLLISAELGRQARDADMAPVNLAGAVAAVVDRYAEAGRPVWLADEVSPLVAAADESLLAEVLGHLVDNSLLHGAAPVRLGVETRGRRAVVTVTDSGPGIAVTDRERVFERFVRLDAAHTKPGIGLGLPIVRAIVGSMGGVVEAEDAPDGVGVTFAVHLHLAPATGRAVDAPQIPEQSGRVLRLA